MVASRAVIGGFLMRIPFGFHVVDDSGEFVDDSDLTQADLLALLAQIDGEDKEDEEEI
jgi:hypothetical protein